MLHHQTTQTTLTTCPSLVGRDAQSFRRIRLLLLPVDPEEPQATEIMCRLVADSEPSALWSFACTCACANLLADLVASGPWTASAVSAPHSRWAFCAACRIQIMCTVALRTMYAQEHAAFAELQSENTVRACRGSRRSQFSEGRMCPYPDVPASVRGSKPNPPQELRRARARAMARRTGLGRALGKYLPTSRQSGRHHAVYPEVCNPQKGAHVALPTDVQKGLPC